MKMLFRDNSRVYKIELKEEEILLEDTSAGEKLTMSHYGFKRFLDWIGEQVNPPRKSVSPNQEVDIWDISVMDKK